MQDLRFEPAGSMTLARNERILALVWVRGKPVGMVSLIIPGKDCV
jgi:hypothetical protein